MSSAAKRVVLAIAVAVLLGGAMSLRGAAAAPAPAPPTLSGGPAQGLVVPTPGSCAPQPADAQGNPLTAILGNIACGIPVISDVTKVATLVGTVLGTAMSWVADPNQGAQAVGGWALWNITGYNPAQPACYSPTSPYGFFASVFLGDVRLSADSIYSDAYNALAAASLVLVLLAGGLRLVRGMADPEVRGEHLILDTVLRVVVGAAAIYVAFPVLSWVLPLITGLSVSLFATLLSVAGVPQVRDPLGGQ